MNLSEHFTLAEFTFSQKAIRFGISNEPNKSEIENLKHTAEGMERVRTILGNLPIHITSGFRCLRLNAAVGSKATSAHVDGYAADFICPSFGTPLEICRKLAESDLVFDQLIHEGTWVHISFAPSSRKQVLTAHFTNGIAFYTKGLS